jgi:type II secretory pathway component HofQ
MGALRRVGLAAAAWPLLWISVAFAQAPPASPPLDPSIPGPRSLDCYERLPTEVINLSLREAATQNTLRLLAQSYKVNMVVTDDVKGTVTLDFYRAPVRDVLQAILDSNGLVCIRQGELLRVSTAARLVQDERIRNDALISRAGRDADLTKRINDLQKQAADSSISLAAAEVTRKNAELIARRGEIKQEIIRLRYADPGLISKAVAAMVGIGPNATFTACRVKKTEDKLVPEALDPAGGGGASAQSEQERTAANLARAASGAYAVQPAAGPGAVVGPPGGLGALPPFSALFGPQPVAPAPPVEAAPGSGGLVGLTPGGSFNISTAETSPTIRTDCESNSIVLRLYDEQMRRAKRAIDEHLDVLPPQVKIESRLEVLNREELFALGVQWGGGGLLSVNSRTAIVGRGFTSGQNNTQGIAPANFSSPNPNLSLTNVIPVSGTTGLATGGNLVNLPISGLLEGAAASGGGGFAFGIVGTNMDLNLALEALRIQNRTQSLARPEVVVSENQKALVSLGEEIPYSTVSAAGTQVQFKNATLKLEVIPAVVCRLDAQSQSAPVTRTGGTHRLRMTVLVQNDTRGLPVDLGANGAPPAINTQKTQTETMMLEGQRLVIGGITQLSTRDQLRKVPIFGDIPVLGWLFKQKGQDNQKRELVVFLTPTVLGTQAPTTTPVCPAPVALKDIPR